MMYKNLSQSYSRQCGTLPFEIPFQNSKTIFLANVDISVNFLADAKFCQSFFPKQQIFFEHQRPNSLANVTQR